MDFSTLQRQSKLTRTHVRVLSYFLERTLLFPRGLAISRGSFAVVAVLSNGKAEVSRHSEQFRVKPFRPYVRGSYVVVSRVVYNTAGS